MNINIETFNHWATLNKDESMERGHSSSVDEMFEILKKNTILLELPFSFIDIGCGNGWVIRRILENPLCNYALGIDGAKYMIKKADNYKIGNFIHTNIEDFKFKNKFDIIFSMETFYYLDKIDLVIKNIYNNGLKKNGSVIIGIDHYRENKSTLNWDKEYNLKIKTLSIQGWYNKFSKYNFSKLRTYQYGAKDNWMGTLIIYAQK